MRLFRRRLLAAAACALASAAQAAVLAGHVSPRLATAAKLDRVSGSEAVSLGLFVNVDQALLDRTLDGLYGPNAPADRRFLTSDEFARLFDLPAKRAKLKEFARASGLTVDDSDERPGSLIVRASGPAAAVESAFGVRLSRYRAADGQVFRANDADPVVPAELTSRLGAVLGLSSYRGAKTPRLARRPASGARPAASPAAAPAALSGMTGPGGGLSPKDIKSLYGVSGTWDGAGQTIALYELDGYLTSDVTLYEQNLFPAPHPNPTVTCVSADGACGLCGSNQNQACGSVSPASDNGMIEAALDIDLAMALAPNAQILVYTAKNVSPDSLNLYSQIAADNLAKIVSISWGEDQRSLGVAEMASENTIFKQMAAQGQSVFAAAGDSGAYDASGLSLSYSGTLLVDDPASQPYVSGVGGTSLTGAVGGSTAETVWNEGCSSASNPGVNCANNGAGGGGVANFSGDWPIPSYQAGVAAYSSTNRNVPDVSLNADPITSPYNICVGGTCNNCASSCTTLIGGTSAAAPLWAALTAQLNQQRAGAGGAPLGFPNTPLYQQATGSSYHSLFNDVVGGNNGFYSAGAGYDNASGWGSFKGDALIRALGMTSTVTAASPEFTNVGTSSITLNWSVSGELAGTVYTARISTDAFATVNASAVTQAAFAVFGAGGTGPALFPATTYYFQVQATTNGIASANADLGLTYTLATAPGAPGLTGVWASSLTMSWTAGANPAGTAYRVDYWQAVGSTSSLITASTAPVLSGLAAGATYFLTVGALNGSGLLAASGTALSTVTIAQPSLTTSLTPSGGTASLHPPSGLITLQVPGGALTAPASLTLSLPASFPSAPSPAGTLIGTGLGVQITAAPDVEPLTNTLLTVSYRPSDVAGLDARRLALARYDPADDVWVPLVSTVDPAAGMVTGVTSHWSLFQLVQSAPSASASSAKAFPNPWRVSQGPASMTFSLLPAGARLRIYTLEGRLVKDMSADASGMASWDGTNQSGRPAASGFYFLYISGSGTGATLKLALQR